jgi:release factor glutamine methyltransferase
MRARREVEKAIDNALMIRDVVERAAKRLRMASVETARQDAWLLLSHVRRQDRATLLAHARDELTLEDLDSFQRLVDRRVGREPLAQIVGQKEFWSLDFQVTTDVLCPRPDSECLIEAALVEVKRRRLIEKRTGRVLDLGTGSGCLLLALLSEWRSAVGIGVDISRHALSIARSNGERLGLAERVHWVCANWGSAFDAAFDLILSNPPYIASGDAEGLAPEVRCFEPELALFAGEDGLEAYRSLADDLRRLLAPDGLACLEIGFGQADAVEALLQFRGLKSLGRRQDLAGIDRCLIIERR